MADQQPRDYEKLAAQYRQEAKEMQSGAGKEPSKEMQQRVADAATAKKEAQAPTTKTTMGKKAGGLCCSASKRADGIAQRGKTKGRMV